jgi:Ca2+-binding RTX toxin-like protein
MPTQSADIIQSQSPIEFTYANETWTVDLGVLVVSTDDAGVDGNGGIANSTLINGGIIRGHYIGATFYGADATVLNNAGGTIIGGNDGLDVDGDTVDGVPSRGDFASIDNKGSIIGLTNGGVGLGPFAEHNSLTNSGDIYGPIYGVAALSVLSASAVIDNYGLIRSDKYGIDVVTAPGLVTTIVNEAGGLIRGSTAAIHTEVGRIDLTNHGTIAGAIDCSSGEKDVIVNSGSIPGRIDLGGGNDVFDGSAGMSGSVFGGPGNDKLVGGSGNDRLHGGVGNDALTGGSGADRFYFDTALNGLTNVDTITDFAPGTDKMVLSKTDFVGIGTARIAAGGIVAAKPLAAADFHVGPHATTSSQHIIYHARSGFLFYDSDGNGPAPQVHFATVGHLILQSTDFLVEA